MSSLEPAESGVVVGFADHEFIGPGFLVVEDVEGFLVGFKWVSEITESEGVVVVAAIFLDADIVGLREDVDEALVGLLSLVVEGDFKSFMGL